jgi:hypothetical protein
MNGENDTMARCKNCRQKGFMLETDANGLCPACAPYYYLSMQDDLKDLEQAIHALNRINNPEAALGRLTSARESLERLRSYAEAGLVRLPMPFGELTTWIEGQIAFWQDAG